MTVSRYIYDEVTRQQYTEDTQEHAEACANMGVGWGVALSLQYAVGQVGPLIEDVAGLGRLVHPTANLDGFRNCRVRIQNRVCCAPEQVPELIKRWCDFVNEGTLKGSEAYVEFEIIHPFRDGNGRTGKIIFNWLNGTLEDPVLPEVPEDWMIP